MSIAWDETLALGDAVIDADHRRMMELIALLETAAGGGEAAGIRQVLAELAQLCRDHFIREEALQARIGFPDREAHRTAHEMLLKRLDAVISHYDDGDAEIRSGIIRTLGDSLATWLISHITNSDMEFKPYMGG
ncbi:hemerythrin [Paramagnetospirillum kuznetsovii]|uniref:Hemerythrin n=1 Tax=Paramagnetospirillum kuznetsovii TaxID=2053833 RepID=A0A364P3S0_9PROT|nr:hemerythrin family protein [Paramagnetospirillum kuznetsovii]RAU23973.1 hemerythrin [Paramagnetospirillum kuznetsovii]